MRSRLLISVIGTLVFACAIVRAQSPPEDLSKLFEKRIGSLSLSSSPTVKSGEVAGLATATYSAPGNQVLVELFAFSQDADAYSRLTLEASVEKPNGSNLNIGSQVGTAGFVLPDRVAFFRGHYFVRVTPVSSKSSSQALTEFAQAFAEKLDKGEGEVPVLIKHLPAWEEAQKSAVFISHFDKGFSEYPVLSVIETQRDADAVLAEYGQSKLLLIEFHTPQLAAENDQRIVGKIQELWKAGEPAPAAYRRVGNYSVFVFGAPDEQTAKQLIDQVKYEQVVQWLGHNPYILKEAQRRYAETTLGVFVAVVKASGFALVGCLGTGFLIGAWLFNRRRLQQRNMEAFSDAGGMLRLNIDELTPQTDPARLLRERN